MLRLGSWCIDALDVGELGEQFDTVLDCGLFHVLSDDRARYIDVLTAVVADGGCCYLFVL